jgi:hypothetical protein
MKIFGASTPRSGARTLSAYLNDAGFNVGYEDTGRHCRKYNNDNEAVRKVYEELKLDGDIGYLTTMALDIILDVYPDAKFIQYIRHPYDVITSLTSPSESYMEHGKVVVRTMMWSPKTGIWRGQGGGSLGIVNRLSMIGRQMLEDPQWWVKLGYVGSTGEGIHVSLPAQMAAYWRMAHEMIAAFIAKLPDDQWFLIRCEDYHERLPALLDWLGCDERPEIQHLNKRPYTKQPLKEGERALAYSICGDVMERYGYTSEGEVLPLQKEAAA